MQLLRIGDLGIDSEIDDAQTSIDLMNPMCSAHGGAACDGKDPRHKMTPHPCYQDRWRADS